MESEEKVLPEASPSDGVLSLKRLYAHYAAKKQHIPSSSLVEEGELEEAAAEATASYAAWKKMQNRLAQFFPK